MEVTATLIKDLRERTGAGMSDCKKALTEVGGDMEKAIDYLRTKGLAKAAKKAGREATEGTIQSYIHANGKIGVLVEIDCNTDFVAKNDDFVAFARDIALHIAAAGTSSLRTYCGAIAAICIATSRVNATKSSLRATKSVSQLISTSTPMRPPAWMYDVTAPSVASRPAFLAAFARPFARR